MDEHEMQQRRAEKHAEAPMAASLRAKVLEAARRDRETKAAAQAVVLCECRCPAAEECACGHRGHCRTLAEAYVEAGRYEYGRQLRAALEHKVVDVGGLLRRAGCPDFAVTRIQQGGLDERPSLYAAKAYQGLVPSRLGTEGHHVRLLAHAQLQRGQRRPYFGLFGDTDRGKTVAAVWAMAESVKRYGWNTQATGSRQSFPFAFVRMAEFAAVLAWDEATRAWLEGLKHARMVILDDMGKEYLSPAAQMMLFELLDTRYGQGASTVITSQLTAAEFQLRYDGAAGADGKPGAIFRRLKERGVILRDGGDAGAVLMTGDTQVKRWPKKAVADVLALGKVRPEKECDE